MDVRYADRMIPVARSPYHFGLLCRYEHLGPAADQRDYVASAHIAYERQPTQESRCGGSA